MTIDIDVMRTETTARTNLIVNPSFETDVANWTRAGVIPSIAQSSTYAKFGTYSAKGTANNNGFGYLYSEYFSASPSDVFVGSAYIRPTATCDVSINYNWYDGSYSYIGTQSVASASFAANVWGRASSIGLPYPGAAYGKLVIEINCVNGMDIYVDGVLAEESSSLADYFDGSVSTNYQPPIYDIATSWTGTAHASTSNLTYKTRINYDRVNSLNFNGGRRTAIDLTASGSCSFEVFNPDHFPSVGEKVEVFSGAHLLWLGYVSDSLLAYGIADNTDSLTISAESYLARAGRAFISITSQTDETVTDLLSTAATSVDLVGQSTPASSILASHDAYAGNLLPYVQRLQMTSFGNVKENGEFIRLITREFPPFTQRGDGFTDSTAATSTQVRFDDLKFAALADNSYDSVRIEPEIVSAVYVGTNSRTFVASTYSASTNDATDLANYINDTFVPSVTSPNEVSFLVNSQTNGTWASILDYAAQGGESTGAGGVVYQRQSISFRGVDYQVVVLGFSFSGNPRSARVTLYLGAESLFPDLVLDDSAFGMLNYSKLG